MMPAGGASLFAVIVQIEGNAETPERISRQHTIYSELAGKYPGMLFKHVAQSVQRPHRFIDVMVWDTQEHSEEFGLDPDYQKQRPSSPISLPSTAERNWANPGYYHDLRNYVVAGKESASMEVGFYRLVPGNEGAFIGIADEIGNKALANPAVSRFQVYSNNGLPHWRVIVIESGPSPTSYLSGLNGKRLADLCSEPPLIDSGEILVKFDFV